MRSVREIRDPEMLRQVAVLLERENTQLHAKLHAFANELARLRGETFPSAQQELAFLKELLAQRERALFGASSEQRPRAERTEPASVPEPRRGHGPSAQPRLPIIERIHALDTADRTCPQCGGTLQEMKGQTEDSEEITVVERQFVLVQHRRQKYRCACNGCVDTAPGPLRLAARPDARGHRYAPAFAVEVALDKYLDHLPLERQARRMHREGLTIDSQTLWDQLEALATVLQPTYEAVRQYVLTAPVIGADETWWRFLQGRSAPRWWAWSVTREDAVAYMILESRSQSAARQVLSGYTGIVIADGYGAYDALARAAPGFTLAHCWAHVRRKFVEAEPHYPGSCGEILDLIGQLYAVERGCPVVAVTASAATREEALQVRAAARRAHAIAIVDAIHAWACRQRALPESSLGKAIAYMVGLWPGLTRFLGDARIPLDNNATERGLRAVVVGRKNHYGSRSQRGTEVAALFYSLIETAKLAGVNPKTYLLETTHAALLNPGATLLPHALLA